MARDEWYDLYESGAVAEEAALRELDSESPGEARSYARVPLEKVPSYFGETERMLREHAARVVADWHKRGRRCPHCHALVEREDAIACLNCASLLVAPLRCVSEGQARALGWIE